jgi:hypothetical protein
MCGAIPPLRQYAFMAWCLVKHRDNFTFTFTLFHEVFTIVKKSEIEIVDLNENYMYSLFCLSVL